MKHLLTRYLNSAAVFDANNDQGNNKDAATLAAEETARQRASIKVEVVKSEKSDDGDNKNNEEDNEDNEDEEKEEQEEEEDTNNENETEEQKKIRLAQEKEDRKQARIQKRIDKLTAESGSKDAEIERLKKQLNEKTVEGLSEEEVERRAAEKAEKIALQKEAERIQKDFDRDVKKLFDSGMKADKEFDKKINEVAKEAGFIPGPMIAILSDLDNENGGDVLAHLANDIDLYEEVIGLTPNRMSQRLIRLSDKLKEAKKTTISRRERSNAPAPIEPIEGHNNRGNVLPKDPTKNMDEYIRIRNIQSEAYRKSKGY